MSQPSAIAAVTETLRSLIAAEGIVPDVTAMPPDQAASPGNRRVNLFLYHIGINAALRNQEFPWQGSGGGDTQTNPPAILLPLQLHYLLTVFADDDIQAHETLGHAMRVLHDHAQLTSTEIASAVQNSQIPLPDADLQIQPERVKVAFLTMSADELMKIWTAFQSPYRLSVAYEASVVLIDSRRPAVSPLPVLRRGADDQGVFAMAGLLAPQLTALRTADGRTAFNTGHTGATVVMVGRNFGQAPLVLLRRILDPSDPGTPILPTALPSDGDGLEKWSILLDPATVPAAGPFALSVAVADPVNPPAVQDGGDGWWRSNELTLGIATKFTAPPSVNLPGGQVEVTLAVEPAIIPGQRLAVLLNGRETAAQTVDLGSPSAPVFTFATLADGTYGVRLRVDGVDLPLIGKDAQGRLIFLPGGEFTIP